MRPLMADSLFGYMNVFLAVYTAGEEESAEAPEHSDEPADSAAADSVDLRASTGVPEHR